MEKRSNKWENSMQRVTHGKRGFTLVELVVALALLAILTAMIVSFSVLVSGYAKDGRAVADYAEDCTQAKEAILAYVRAEDVAGGSFTVGADTLRTANGTVSFADNTLTVADTEVAALDTLDGIAFDQNGKLLRCTLTGKDGEDFVFVLSLRFATLNADGKGS